DWPYEDGYADSEESAVAASKGAIREIANGRRAYAAPEQRLAYEGLKELNRTKRAAKPAPDTSDARPTEYLFGYNGHAFAITKKTAKRIYYRRGPVRWNAHTGALAAYNEERPLYYKELDKEI